jgi:hypothetical protein
VLPAKFLVEFFDSLDAAGFHVLQGFFYCANGFGVFLSLSPPEAKEFLRRKILTALFKEFLLELVKLF